MTSIDRDGRSVVKCSTFAACVKLKNEIEKKGTRTTLASTKLQPLKVAIFHKNTVACQSFGLQLLHWFQEFLGYSAKFRSGKLLLTNSHAQSHLLNLFFSILRYCLEFTKQHEFQLTTNSPL